MASRARTGARSAGRRQVADDTRIGPTVEHEVARYRAPGGWRRALLGFAVGVAAGLLAALVLPRDDGPRRDTTRRRPSADRSLDRDQPAGTDGT